MFLLSKRTDHPIQKHSDSTEHFTYSVTTVTASVAIQYCLINNLTYYLKVPDQRLPIKNICIVIT